jgi:hypothetical protein
MTIIRTEKGWQLTGDNAPGKVVPAENTGKGLLALRMPLLPRGTEKTILFDTGELGTGIKEQSLLIYTGDGSIVIIEGTREIEPVRAGYGQGAFVVVKAKRAKPRTGD